MEVLTRTGAIRTAALAAVTVFLCLTLSPAHSRAQDEEKLRLYEQKIKAGLVYNFLKYTSWPRGDVGNLRVCLLGSDAFDGYLSPLEGRTAQQSVIVISRLAKVSEAGGCHLVFIHRSQESAVPEILRFLKDKQILTVSDIGQFARKGGMVELATEDQRINMYINQMAVSRAGLNIEDRLMKLAKIVSG